MTLVGDPRQTTYRTHYEAKYKKYAGGKIVNFVQDNIAGMNIDTTTLSTSHRNNQIICDLANQMYPDMKAGSHYAAWRTALRSCAKRKKKC